MGGKGGIGVWESMEVSEDLGSARAGSGSWRLMLCICS